MAILHSKHSKSEETIAVIDADIQKYIKNNSTDNYEEVIKRDNRWEVFFHLSDLRTGLFSWYDFKPGSFLLEMGGGFGALTGVFCKKCAQVSVVEKSLFRAKAICERYASEERLVVYADSIEDISFQNKFDYIVLAGELETIGQGSSNPEVYAAYLRQVLSWLKPDGILLLAVENRYGLKYFCGAAEPYTGVPFAGINRYTSSENGRSFAKHEIIEILTSCGINGTKFYYPLPDYKIPQLIYSDAYPPEKNLNERLIPYYLDGKTLLANELDLYNDIIDNKVFDFFANSFLIECGNEEAFCSVNYAALSTDRGRDKAFATIIAQDGLVRKAPLYDEGKAHAKLVYEYINDLKARGVPVVSHQWDGKELSMPFVRADTLSNYLKKLVSEDKNEFLNIIERLYQVILTSSEIAANNDNALLNESNRSLDWGPIVKKAYLELIPLNCFYQNKNFLFFDQEYVRKNYPAKYVLFRALHYIYVFAPHTEQYVPLQSLKEKYGLSELWDIFVQEENGRFLREVRRQEIHRHFYRWTAIDVGQIKRNAALLGLDAEVGVEYKVSDKMKRIWQVQLDLLRVLAELCEKHQLQYFMIYGSLLGAVRHQGFIPWDDDADIAMPRADYEKLKNIAATELGESYFLQTMENDPECFYGGYMRLRNSETTGISRADFGKSCNNGIWIDVLPLDVCTMDQQKLQSKARKIKFWQSLLYAKVYGKAAERFYKMPAWEKSGYCWLAKLWSHRFLCRQLQAAITAYTECESEYLAIFTHFGKYQIFDKRDFSAGVNLSFENMRLPAPKGYKRCLEMSMGRDYMNYPPLAQRKPHHAGIFSPHIPFQRCQDLFMGLFDGAEGKDIVIFGAGLMFENYMKKYGKSHRPVFIVDNDKEKWGGRRQGLEIRGPGDIANIPENKRHLIICSVYYREIERQLQRMGISRYKIYVQEKEWILRDEVEERLQ